MSIASQLLLLGVVFVLLVVTAAAVIKVHQIVRFESGLTNTDILRRMWSKSDQILLRPVQWPLAFAIFGGAGFRYTLEMLVISLLQIFDLMGPETAGGRLIVSALCYACGAIAAVLLYHAVGGQRVSLLLCGLLCAYVLLYLSRVWGQHGPTRDPFTDMPQVLVVLIQVGAISLITVVSGIWADRQPGLVRHPGARPADSSQASFPYIPMLVWALFLWATALAREIILNKFVRVPHHHYLARVTGRVADMMMFVCCAFVAIWTTNRSVMAGNYNWQWPSIIVPGLPVAVFGVLYLLYELFWQSPDLGFAIHEFVVNTLLCSSSGLLGAVAYLGVVARYARKALDPGAEGQSELLDDDDSDEFEMEP